MRIIISSIFYIFISFAIIKAQDTEIIDPIVEVPYEIKNEKLFLKLPDSLGGKNIQGQVYIQLVINDSSKIIETTILKIFLKNKKNKKIIEYNFLQGKIPAKLNRYAIFFDKYCKKEIIIVKRHKPNPKNVMYIKLNIE